MCFISSPFLESAIFSDSYHAMLDKIFKFVDVYYQ